jgi:ArsR family transcriptional regulator
MSRHRYTASVTTAGKTEERFDEAEDGVTDIVMLRALAHPVRLGVLRRLAQEPETCACDFTDVFAVSQPTISQHLKVLREAGLVQTRRRGTQICYSIRPGSIVRLRDLLCALQPGAAAPSPAG